MPEREKLTDYFGLNLAKLLASRFEEVGLAYDSKKFQKDVKERFEPLGLTARVELIADSLKDALEVDYSKSIPYLIHSLGPENPNETGMFTEKPEPVFEILNNLKEDSVKFVKKSVANHLTDYLKVNYNATRDFIRAWQPAENEHTRWIIKTATRKITI